MPVRPLPSAAPGTFKIEIDYQRDEQLECALTKQQVQVGTTMRP